MANVSSVDAATMRTWADQLESNGADIQKVSRGLAIVLRYHAEVVEHGFVTPAECTAKHKQTVTECGMQIADAVKTATGGLTLATLVGKLGETAVVSGALAYIVYVVGKGLGWI
jgi:hypothetical protein